MEVKGVEATDCYGAQASLAATTCGAKSRLHDHDGAVPGAEAYNFFKRVTALFESQ